MRICCTAGLTVSQVQLKISQFSSDPKLCFNYQSSFENSIWSQFPGQVERKLLLIHTFLFVLFHPSWGPGVECSFKNWTDEFLGDTAPLQQHVLEPMGEGELLLEEQMRREEVDEEEEEKHREEEVGGARAGGRVRGAAVGSTRLGRRHWVRRWNIWKMKALQTNLSQKRIIDATLTEPNHPLALPSHSHSAAVKKSDQLLQRCTFSRS